MSEQAAAWIAALSWWMWELAAIVLVALIVCAACKIWAIFHQSILLDRARAHASRGVHVKDEDVSRIHLHVRPWGVTVHMPRGWMTEAEAIQFADDIARAWTRSVREVKPTRCMWGGLMAVRSIRL